MRYLFIIALVGAGYLGWKKYKADQAAEPAPINDPNRTPGANAENRMNNLTGQVPLP